MKKKKLKSILGVMLAAVLLVCCLGGCTQPEQSSEAPRDSTSSGSDPTVNLADIKIGYLVKTLSGAYWQAYAEGAKAAAKDLGVQIDVRDVPTESDFKAQYDVAMTMINQNYSAIVAASITNTNLIPAMAEANKKGIPWVVVGEEQDAPTLQQQNAHYVAQCRLAFYDEGVIAGEYIAEQLSGKGKVAIIEGMAGTSANTDRIAGFKAAIAAHPEINVVASQPGEWMREKARDVTAAILQANPDIKGIFALNDTMALGVVAAIDQAGKKGEIAVIGDDGTKEAFESIIAGHMSATIDGVAWQIGYFSVCAAVKAVVEDEDKLPDYSLKPALITKDNVNEAMQLSPKPISKMSEININPYLPIKGITK